MSDSAVLLDPKNDYVFKRLFVERLDLLTDLVNVVRGDVEPLRVVEVLNPRITPEEIAGKEIVLDVRAQDALGRVINVEIQVQGHSDYPSRALFYIARAFVEQIGQGENYGGLRSVIGVNLLDFVLFREPGDEGCAQWRFLLATQKPPVRRLDVQLELNFLELPKLRRLEAGGKALYDWVRFFSDVNGEAMQEVTHPEVLQAVQVLKSISASPQERRDAEMRLKYHRDITAIKSFGWEEGREEGIALGEARGKAEGIALGEARGKAEGIALGEVRGQLEGKASILVTLLTLKFGSLTPTTLAQIHAASPQQLDQWAEQILTAPDLDSLMRRT